MIGYKNIIRSKNLRLKILKYLRVIPDSIMVRIQYRIKLGFWPDLKHPKRFTEKIQLYKLKYRSPNMWRCVDKYEVRNFVNEKGCGDILVKLYGIYENAEEIDYDHLPYRFVVKTTDGSGGNNVLICADKGKLDWGKTVRQVNGWRNCKDVNPGREWAYTGIPQSRIIIEEYLNSGDRPLVDYKFFCFKGEPKFLYVVTDRVPGSYGYFGIYSIDFKKIDVYRKDERKPLQIEKKPENYEKMIEIARLLSSDFPHVRVDLYNVKGRIYFGELTFYDGSGYFSFDPDEFDFKVGEWFTEY